jgi:DNA-binding NarL/FixJ family response regulator
LETVTLTAPGRVPANGDRPRRSVYVFARDPLLHAGAVTHVSREVGLSVVEEDGVDAGTVVVAVSDTFDRGVEDAVAGLSRRGARGTVLIVDELDRPRLMEALAGGVRAVLWRREATAEALRRAVATVWSGGGRLPADLLGELLGVLRGQRSPRTLSTSRAVAGLLSARETEVLRLAADGYGTHEIADRLSYSERTIKAILHGVTERLELRNRTHAVAFLIRHGVI